jgi:hypothetical protein
MLIDLVWHSESKSDLRFKPSLFMRDKKCKNFRDFLRVFSNFFNFKRPLYERYFGGVTILTVEQFKKSNGYSNLFFGWGNTFKIIVLL